MQKTPSDTPPSGRGDGDTGIPRPAAATRNWRAKPTRRNPNWLSVVALMISGLLMLPVVAVAVLAMAQDNGTIAHLWRTVMPEYLWNTLTLLIGVGIGVGVIGTATAWLIAMCEFPGRRFFEWALIMPLAIPAYILAYAYTDLLSHPGLVQSTLRDVTGLGARDYWFPNVRSTGGAICMFILVLYPYTYLLARTAFLEQSTCFTEVARTLGRSAWQSFRSISLPLARPAIAAGVGLALMETLADFGTVAHFGVRTFTTGIYNAWLSMDDMVAAAQLATALLSVVLTLVLIERIARGNQRYSNAQTLRPITSYRLTRVQAGLAIVVCGLPVALGFIVPVLVLSSLAWSSGHNLLSERYLDFTANSVLFASVTAVLAVILSLLLAYAARLAPGWRSMTANRLANLGYAIPGSIIAIAVLIPFGAFDNALDGFARETFGVSTGLLLTGTMTAMVFAYLVRFMAVALDGVEASLARIPGSIDAAARTLGESQLGTLRRVHLPILSGGVLTAGLMVFVDVMKELPATLILSPFNFETLAVQAHKLASDERLAQAASPSLALVAVGLIPVIILSRRIIAMRAGRGRRSQMTEPQQLPAAIVPTGQG
jgi:iron(III) transport system permease protein